MSYLMELSDLDSSLIREVEYYEEDMELTIRFKKYYVDELTYINVPLIYFTEFTEAKSFGKYYLSMVKPIFKLKNSQKMADRVIKCKIDVTKINKDYLFTGEKGVYLNFTFLQNDKEDQYGNHGMLVQDVPTEVYKKDKTIRGVILGNAKEMGGAKSNPEGSPGVESGKMGVKDDMMDDLPF